MKIEIKNLRPNPFRAIDEYPINPHKVKGLVKSIKDTTFWDNLLARPVPEKKTEFEIAYGHHRLEALYEIYGKRSTETIDIPVRDLDDLTMLRIMANENATDWAMDTGVVTETVKAAERFLKTHPELTCPGNSLADRIAQLLGGVFEAYMISTALAIIHAIEDKKVDEKAVKTIKEPAKAYEFVRAVKQSDKPIPVADQRDMAKLIKEEKVARADIKKTLRQWGHGAKKEEKKLPDVAEFLHENHRLVEKLYEYVKELAKVKGDLAGVEWLRFKTSLKLLRKQINALLETEEGNDGKEKTREKKEISDGRSRRLLS